MRTKKPASKQDKEIAHLHVCNCAPCTRVRNAKKQRKVTGQSLSTAELDAMGAILDLAYDDQRNYLTCGSPETDYGKEWPDAAERKAETFRLVATIADKLGLAGERERWDTLAADVQAR